jgi:uncharacterized protein (TIGR03435 family)
MSVFLLVAAKGLTAEGIRLADLAIQLSDPMERPVIDRTGLTGRYDIRLDVSALQPTDGNREKDDVCTALSSATSVVRSSGVPKIDIRLSAGDLL